MRSKSKQPGGGGGSRRSGVGFPEIAAWLCLLAAYAPVLYWLLRSLAQSQQLRDAVVVLATALAYFVLEGKINVHGPRPTKLSAVLLACAYVLLITAGCIGIWGAVAAFAGLSVALVSLGLACTNRDRYAYAAGLSFFLLAMLSLFIKLFDMPLRILAGKSAAWGLSLFNKSVLLMGLRGETPQVALMVDGRTYLVASECNGFGIMSACLLLSVVVSVLRRNATWRGRASIAAICVFLGFSANAVRIVCITLAAPLAGAEYYDAVHEFLGYLFFAAALLCACFVSSRAFPAAGS